MSNAKNSENQQKKICRRRNVHCLNVAQGKCAAFNISSKGTSAIILLSRIMYLAFSTHCLREQNRGTQTVHLY